MSTNRIPFQVHVANWVTDYKDLGWQINILPSISIFYDAKAWCICLAWFHICIEVWINGTDDLEE